MNSLLLQAIQANGFWTDFWISLSNFVVVLIVYAFINDMDLIEIAKLERDSIEDVVVQMQ